MDNQNIEREQIENIYGNISPFELKNKLISLAKKQTEKSARTLLDAGRGNPNWTAATPREAFFSFGLFAVEETRRVWNQGDLAGMPQRDKIYDRFKSYISSHKNLPGIELLDNIVEYAIEHFNFNPDDFVYELADGIIGDNYPVPDRMLVHTEKIVHKYLIQEIGYKKNVDGKFKLFAVEGATAAMCYIFDSLISNHLLSKGDKIALMVPIFTPYLEIPHLSRYNFNVVEINASDTEKDGSHNWQYPKSELEKLKDTSIKALFVVNPSNPPSVAIRPESVKQLVEIVKEYNPNLMIISDDVYGTFVDNFRSLVADLPYNSIGVYSFSKYFGVTGWRLGIIALHEKNIFDQLLKDLPKDKKDELHHRYEALAGEPEDISFIDRIVADSRQVALNHTAGLSTPQQIQMAFLCLFALIDKENKYKQLTIDICRRRKKLLFDSLGLKLKNDPNDASYYTEFNLLDWAYNYYGDDFAAYLKENKKPIDILFHLAEKSSIVLLDSSGFHGPEWSVRISLANLQDEDYVKIGEVLHTVLDDFVADWKSNS